MQSQASQLSKLLKDLKASKREKEILEQNLDRVQSDLRVALDADDAYSKIYHENEMLKHELKWLTASDQDIERSN